MGVVDSYKALGFKKTTPQNARKPSYCKLALRASKIHNVLAGLGAKL